jgi:DNA-binding IclR family transcriptional regulator
MSSSQGIRGNTLRVYLHLVKNGPCELRDVQHGLGLSSPSLASYHLTKLIASGYAKQDELGRYLMTNESSTQILEGYSKVGTAIVPQFFFFAVLFTILTAFSYETLYSVGFATYLAAVSAAMLAAIWYETWRLWRRLVGE